MANRTAPLVQAGAEECNDWGSFTDAAAPLDPAAAQALAEQRDEQTSKNGMCVAICSVLVAIPAIIGSWCWPVLVGAIFAVGSGAVSGKLVDMFHAIQLAVTFGVMSNIVQFSWWTCKRTRKGNHWAKFGPVYLLMIATVLVMVQPTYFVVQGAYKWPNAFIHKDANSKYNFLFPNTLLGWMVQIFCTYLGYLFMFIGVCQTTQLHKKLGKKWRQARNAPRQNAV